MSGDSGGKPGQGQKVPTFPKVVDEISKRSTSIPVAQGAQGVHEKEEAVYEVQTTAQKHTAKETEDIRTDC